MKKIYFYGIMFLALIYAASAIGVTRPIPQEIQLLPGQSNSFKFQIQSDDYAIDCTYDLEMESILDVGFETPKIVLQANEKEYVTGTITAPEDAPSGEYSTKFCVRCSPLVKEEGKSSTRFNYCDLPLSVSIVSQRTKENILEIPEVQKPPYMLWIWAILIAIIAATIIWLIWRKIKKG